MTREAMRFVERQGDAAVVAAPSLRQAALALHGARALSRDCTAPRIACRSIATSASWSTSIPCSRPTASTRNAQLPAPRRADTVRPAYMGLIKQLDDQLGRLFDRSEEARPLRRHADRLHLRPRRLSRRPLAGREGDVLRRDRSACPSSSTIPIPRPTRRAARSTSASSRRSTSCRPVLDALAASPRTITSSKAARCCRCCAASASPTGATRCSPSSTIPSAARDRRWAAARATAAPSWCAPTAGSTSAGRISGRSCSTSRPIRTSCTTSAPRRLRAHRRRDARAPARHARRVEAAHDRVRRRDRSRTAAHKRAGVFFGQW